MTSSQTASSLARSMALVVVVASCVLGSSAAAQRGQTTVTDQPDQTPDTQTERERARQQRRARGEETRDDGSRERPYRAVFGGASRRNDLTKTLSFNGTLSEAYDQNRLADATSPDASRLSNSGGFYSALVGDMTFARKGNRLELAANGGANARYYRDLRQFLGTDYHVGAGVSARLSPRTSVRVSQAFSYAPIDLLGVFVTSLQPALGAVAQPSTDFAVNTNRSAANSTSGELSRRVSARADLSLTASTRLTRFLADPTGNNRFRERGGGGTYRYRMTPNVGLRLGYGYRRAQYRGTSGSALSPAEHSLDLGLDIRRTLSDSRRTYFNLKTGSSVVQAPTPANMQLARRQLRVLVDASLTQQLGETWQMLGTYRRGSDLVEGLAAPVFTDAWSFSTSGFLSRHVDLRASAAYSTGAPSLVVAAQNFTSYTGDARLRIALGQKSAMTAEYLYYFYDFSKTPQLALGYAPRFSRNSVKVGLSLWVPVWHR